MRSGHTLVLGDRLCLPNGQQIPNDGIRRGLKHGIDTWLVVQDQVAPAPAHHVAFVREAPLHHIPTNHDNRVPSVRIDEVKEAQVINNEGTESDDENVFDFFQIFVTEKRKRETRRSRLPELQSSTSSANVIPPIYTPETPPAPVTAPPAADPTVPSIRAAFTAALSASDTVPTEVSAAPHLQYCYQSTESPI